MSLLIPVSDMIRKLAQEAKIAEAITPVEQYVYYQEFDQGYPTTTEEGAGKHMNTETGNEFEDPNDSDRLTDSSKYPLDYLMNVRPGDRDQYTPDTSFHTSPYASEEKNAAAPWGEDYSRPRDGGLGIYSEPATLPRGGREDNWDQEEGQQPRVHGAPHDQELGDQDSRYMFFDRASYPSIPR